ncbi:hypothetical protein PAPYR_11742 [Paratrimastix pyriformis]|uniref:Uncharacterized protein n=1 Tax=Paratrimastix pyriformis TaxID=342808 RepID=A0ABQ8U350_9EUKA|nr:hypothetical protein PAPYR_11742 [Paratrimastix pyriformis]
MSNSFDKILDVSAVCVLAASVDFLGLVQAVARQVPEQKVGGSIPASDEVKSLKASPGPMADVKFDVGQRESIRVVRSLMFRGGLPRSRCDGDSAVTSVDTLPRARALSGPVEPLSRDLPQSEFEIRMSPSGTNGGARCGRTPWWENTSPALFSVQHDLRRAMACEITAVNDDLDDETSAFIEKHASFWMKKIHFLCFDELDDHRAIFRAWTS